MFFTDVVTHSQTMQTAIGRSQWLPTVYQLSQVKKYFKTFISPLGSFVVASFLANVLKNVSNIYIHNNL
jgi:hypothetical protein